MTKKKRGKSEKKVDKTLESICKSSSTLSPWFKPGFQAIKKEYRGKIKVSDTKLLGGSVDFDMALQQGNEKENRWDYGFDYEGNLIFIEFHPAQTSEIKCIIKKVEFTEGWLKNNCPEILSLPKFEKGNRQFYWVATNNVGILGSSNIARRFALKRIKMVGSVFDYEKLKNKE